MKISYSSTDNLWNEDYRADEMSIYDKDDHCIGSEHVGPLCECPEDAIIGRDLISCDTIIEYMKLAYEAGKNGEEFTVEYIEWDE